jgi:aldose 1-epimerase
MGLGGRGRRRLPEHTKMGSDYFVQPLRLLLCLPCCCIAPNSQAKDDVELKRERYLTEIDGKKVDLYSIKNKNGMVVKITNWGAKVQQILVPDKDGELGDVALGYESIDQLRAGQPSMGAFIGRYANRIGQARFTLNGQDIVLAANSGPNSLNGGQKGSRFVVFDAKQNDDAKVQMTYVFEDGEESYPGSVPLRVIYAVSDDNEFSILYDAVAADATTVVNFTTHTYFNLAGQGNGDVLGHLLTINADNFTPIDKTLVPTGEIRTVKGTPMDFTEPVMLGARIEQEYDQLKLAGGYDHNYVLNKKGDEFSFAARVCEPTSGRVMEVWSTEPGLQLFSGNSLAAKIPRDAGKGGAVYGFRTGFCLEPQHFPDSPNKPNFPSTVLKSGEWYSGKTVYTFSVRNGEG